MNVAVRRPDAITVDQFLARIDRCPPNERWQLIGGEIVRMMTGGTWRHARIAAVVQAALQAAVGPRGCYAIPDMLVRNPQIDDTAVAPDILVECGPSAGTERTVEEPVVVVEILSPSTMSFDRGAKLAFYQSLPSVTHVVLIYQDEMRVETWSRPPVEAPPERGDEQGAADDAEEMSWAYRVADRPDDSMDLPTIGFAMPLAAVYGGVNIADFA